MATWTIEANQNNGYPINLNFLVDKIPNRWQEGEYNLTNWRIKSDFDVSALNTGVLAPIVDSPNAYPHIWAATQIIGSSGGGEEGDGTIDPSGYQKRNRNKRYGTNDTLTSSKTGFDTSISSISSSVADAVQLWLLSSTTLKTLIKKFCNWYSTSTGLTWLEQMNGGSMMDYFLGAKIYPFQMPADILGATKQFNVYGITATDMEPISLTGSVCRFDFGDVTLGVTEGWQIKDCQYQIYLPYCGTFNLPVFSNGAWNLIAFVDIIEGVITYVLTCDDEFIMSAQGNIGVKVPINLREAIQKSNFRTTISNSLKGAITDTLGGNHSETALKSWSPEVLLTGDNVAASCLDQQPKILVRKAQILDNAYCYNCFKGLNYSKYSETFLSFVGSGLVRCYNYDGSALGATEEEKEEIKRYMESGVIL